MLRGPASLHVHSVAVLPGTRSHPRQQVRHAHRHVVTRLYPGRTPDRLPSTSGRGRKRPTRANHRVAGNATCQVHGWRQADEDIHFLQGAILLLGKEIRQSVQGIPRYCTVTQAGDGSTILGGGRSKRGKMRGPPGSRSWNSALKNMGDELFIDFLKRCLDWDPETRMTPQQALKHQWLRRRLPILPRRDENGVDNDGEQEVASTFTISFL